MKCRTHIGRLEEFLKLKEVGSDPKGDRDELQGIRSCAGHLEPAAFLNAPNTDVGPRVSAFRADDAAEIDLDHILALYELVHECPGGPYDRLVLAELRVRVHMIGVRAAIKTVLHKRHASLPSLIFVKRYRTLEPDLA